MANVCQKCGDRGNSELLVSCSGCNKYAEHQYCFDEIPKEHEENIQWLCEECESKSCNTSFEEEESKIPYAASLPQILGTYSFRDREKHSIKILRDKKIIGGTISLNGSSSRETYVSRKKKHKLSLPPKPHKPNFGNRKGTKVSKGTSSQLKLDTYLFCDREKHYIKILSNKKTNRSRKSINRILISDITNVANVSQEQHVPPFKDIGLKTWGRYRKRVLNREKSSLGTTTNSLKDDTLHDFHDLVEEKSNEVAKPSVHTRKLLLPVDELPENFVQDDLNSDECKQGERGIQLGEGGSSILLEHNEDLNLRKRKNENPPRVDERSPCLGISQHAEEKEEPINEFYYISAWPIVNYSWRGFFKISGRTYGPFNAHLSTKACEKAWNATKALPPIAHLSMVSRLHAWPKSVEVSPPTDDHIALFFFPCYSWVEEMVELLLQEIIRCDVVLKIVMDHAELLVMPSALLPRDYQKFEDKFYLWGTFKARKHDLAKTGDHQQDQLVTNHTAISKQVENGETQLCKSGDDQEKNGKEENECSHLTDESGGNQELTDSANRKSCKNESCGCLELFPVEVENIALMSQLGEGKHQLDLELSLSLPFTK